MGEIVTKVQLTTTDSNDKTSSQTFSDVKNDATDAQIQEFAAAVDTVTEGDLSKITKTQTEDIDLPS
ncbi:MAG: hypothetical protein ATN35_12720 [Epulopiscium sp. Nele67-Bin004]|nr:MAG: hypothetical protein ATN35_12720 [Epulopiscium sp. Nele67-Bin004]